MSDVQEVENAEVEYTEGDEEFVNHESIISADRASRMANMVSSGIVDPESGNKVYFENKPALEVAQFQSAPEAKIEEPPQVITENEIVQPNNEQKHEEIEEKQEVVVERGNVQTLEIQLNQSSQANRLGDEILQESHEEVGQADFKWNSGFNSKTQRKDSQNSHPSEELEVLPTHNKSDIEEENHKFERSQKVQEESHIIEQLKPSHHEEQIRQEVSEQKADIYIPNNLVEQTTGQIKEKIEVVQVAEEHSHPIQLIDNNTLQVESNIKEQQKRDVEVVPAERQHHQQRVLPNKSGQSLLSEKEVNQEAVQQKVAQHHVERQVIHEADESNNKQQQIVSQPQVAVIRDNNIPSAVFSEEVPIPSEAPIQKEIKQEKTHHQPKENLLEINKQNHELPSNKPVHTYHQIQHEKEEKKASNEAPKSNERPPSIKRQSMHINSVRQKPPVQQRMKKPKDNCTCEIM